MLCALVTRTPTLWQRVVSNRRVLVWGAGGMALVLLWLSCNQNPFPGAMITGGYSVLACFYSCCLLIVLTRKGIVQRLLSSEALKGLGTIAYCTYLLHLPLMNACRRLLGIWFLYTSSRTRFVSGLLGIALTILTGTISWRFFQSPMLRRGHAYRY